MQASNAANAHANEPGSQPVESCARTAPDQASDAARSPAPAAKTRAKRNPQARKRAIADAAAKLLAEEGAQRLTHRRVAQEAGVPLGSTTQYFKDIDELRRAGYERLAAMVEEDYAQFIETLENSPEADEEELIIAWVCDYLDMEESIRMSMTLYAGALKDPALREIADRSDKLFEEVLTRCMSKRAARDIAMLADGAIVRNCVFKEPVDKGDFERTVRMLARVPDEPEDPAGH